MVDREVGNGMVLYKKVRMMETIEKRHSRESTIKMKRDADKADCDEIVKFMDSKFKAGKWDQICDDDDASDAESGDEKADPEQVEGGRRKG